MDKGRRNTRSVKTSVSKLTPPASPSAASTRSLDQRFTGATMGAPDLESRIAAAFAPDAKSSDFPGLIADAETASKAATTKAAAAKETSARSDNSCCGSRKRPPRDGGCDLHQRPHVYGGNPAARPLPSGQCAEENSRRQVDYESQHHRRNVWEWCERTGPDPDFHTRDKQTDDSGPAGRGTKAVAAAAGRISVTTPTASATASRRETRWSPTPRPATRAFAARGTASPASPAINNRDAERRREAFGGLQRNRSLAATG